MAITLDEYRASLAQIHDQATLERLNHDNVILPCACGDEGCEGWAIPSRALLEEAKYEHARFGIHPLRGMDLDVEPLPVLP